MRKLAIAVAALLIGVMAWPRYTYGEAVPSENSTPAVTAGIVARGPVIDGTLDDLCWAQGGVITNFMVYGALTNRDTQSSFRLLTDGQWLYLGGEIKHPNPSEIKPFYVEHDSAVMLDDSIEWFIDPGTKGELYFHYMVNAINTRLEQRVVNKNPDRAWNMAWRSATRITPQGWMVEAAIPMSLLASAGDLKQARMNACVTRVLPRIDPQGVRVGEARQATTWAPMSSGFHEPERFGRLKGMEAAKVSGVYLPRLDGVDVKGYDMQGSNFQYGVKIVVRNDSAMGGTAEVALEDNPLVGKGVIITAALPQAGQVVTETNMVVPVSDMGTRGVRVTLKVGGDEWESISLKEIASLRALRAYLDRNYYTTEKQGWAIGEFGLPEEALKGKVMKVVGDGGMVLGEAPAGKTTKLGFELHGLKEGRTKLAVELTGKEGSAICRQELICIKRAPKPGFEWKNNQENRVLLRDGKPFFLRAINMSFYGETNIESGLSEMQATGFNAVMVAKDYVDPTNTAYFDLAQKHELLVIPWMDNYCARRPRYNGGTTQLKCALYIGFAQLTREEKTRFFADEFHYQLPRLLEAARRIKEHPAFLAYFIFDEPVDKRIFDQMTPAHEFYRALAETDGYHPVMANYAGYIPEGNEYVDWCDVLAADCYWVPPATEITRTTPNLVSIVTANTWRRADLNRNPIWIIPVAEFSSGNYKRAIAPREQFCQSYLALIHGAKGLIYFTYPFSYQFSVDAFKALNEQLQVLERAVLAPTVPQLVRYDPGEFDPEAGKYPDVQAALFRHPEGGYALLAANSRPYPVDVDFAVSLLGKSGNVTRLFADDTYRVKNGTFKDTLENFGVRAYRIGQQLDLRHARHSSKSDGGSLGEAGTAEAGGQNGEPAAPVQIKVLMKAHPEAATPEPVIPRTGRVGKKNLVQNPGFELATLPGAPDYLVPSLLNNRNGPRCGQPGAWMELVSRRPYEGKHSLKLICDMSNSWNGVTFYLAPRTGSAVPVTYVFSAYMRADRNGVEAALFPPYPHEAKFGNTLKLTKEWKRYHLRVTLPANVSDYQMFGVGVRFGTIWVDAMQLELGTEPTDYEP